MHIIMETSTSIASNNENSQEMESSEIAHAPEGLPGLNDTSPKYKAIIIDGMAIVNATSMTEIITTCMILHKSFLNGSVTWLAITMK